MKLSLAAAVFLVLLAFSLPASAADWPMPGANPARTSWSAEEVPGPLAPLWYRPLEPYISQNVHVSYNLGRLAPRYDVMWASVGDQDGTGNRLWGAYVWALLRVMPHLPAELREKVRTYVQEWQRKFPVQSVAHIGWRDGAKREHFDLHQLVSLVEAPASPSSTP